MKFWTPNIHKFRDQTQVLGLTLCLPHYMTCFWTLQGRRWIHSQSLCGLRNYIKWSAGSSHISIHWDLLRYVTKPVQTCTGPVQPVQTGTIDTGMMCGHRGTARDVPSHSKAGVQVWNVSTFDLRPAWTQRRTSVKVRARRNKMIFPKV